MAIRRGSDSGREAVIWLATWVVLALGAAASLVVIFGVAEDKNSALWRAAAAFGVVVFVLWLLRPTEQMNAYRAQYSNPNRRVWWKPWTWFATEAERKSISMKEMKKAASRRPSPVAAAGPPTAERVREIVANTNAWVPAATPPRGRSPEQSTTPHSKQTRQTFADTDDRTNPQR